MTKPETEKRERGSAIFVAVLVIVLAALAYPLSAGPVGWAIVRCGSPAWTQPYFESAYVPVLWLQDHDQSRLLDSYFRFWWR